MSRNKGSYTPNVKSRLKRLVETFIAKKYVAWVAATVLLWFAKISGTDWCLLTAGIFVIDAYSKTKLLPPGVEA